MPAGQVFLNDGTTPAEGAIVYVNIKDIDGLDDPGISALASVLVDAAGYWSLELINVRTQDYQDLFIFTEDDDNIKIRADDGPNGVGQLETPATDNSVSLSPDIILE